MIKATLTTLAYVVLGLVVFGSPVILYSLLCLVFTKATAIIITMISLTSLFIVSKLSK